MTVKRFLDFGFVYVLWCPYLPLWFKFGYTERPDKRHVEIGDSLTRRIGIKIKLRKLALPFPWAQWCERKLLNTWGKANLRTDIVPESSGHTEWAWCSGFVATLITFLVALFWRHQPFTHCAEMAGAAFLLGFFAPLDAVFALAILWALQWGVFCFLIYLVCLIVPAIVGAV